MKLKLLFAFELGFAAGFATLAVLLFISGVLPKRAGLPPEPPVQAFLAQSRSRPRREIVENSMVSVASCVQRSVQIRVIRGVRFSVRNPADRARRI